MRVALVYFYFALLLTPHYSFVVFFYFPVVLIAISFSAITSGLYATLNLRDVFKIQCMTYVPIALIIFYILQRRELKWYFS